MKNSSNNHKDAGTCLSNMQRPLQEMIGTSSRSISANVFGVCSSQKGISSVASTGAPILNLLLCSFVIIVVLLWLTRQRKKIFGSLLSLLQISMNKSSKKKTQHTQQSSQGPLISSSSSKTDLPATEVEGEHDMKHHMANRKVDFLQRIGKDEYGYRRSPIGYIDEWRPKEFPNLQFPLGYCETNRHREKNEEVEKEIYLDYAGSALPMKSQLNKICKDLTIYANPHSTGPAASRTLEKVKQMEKRILSHFHALPGRYASLKLPESFGTRGKNNTKISWTDRHAGYDVVFTSGATEGFKIIAERFPWNSGRMNKGEKLYTDRRRKRPRSILMYATNSHNSVVGMRQLALRQGAIFYAIDLKELENMTVQEWKALEEKILTNWSDHQNEEKLNEQDAATCISNYDDKLHTMEKRHLLVFPLECNFGGDCPNALSIIAAAKQCGWYTMLDIAKAASTGPVNMRELDPDFAALSFYKLFGDPTGIGALLVKRSSIPVLFENDENRLSHFQGGGSVNIMLPKQDYMVPKGDSPSTLLASLTSGSIHFRGIVNLKHGFETLDQLGGMIKIRQHATCLAREFVQRLQKLKHGNGRKAMQIYGAWSDNLRNHDKNLRIQESFTPGPTVAFNVIRSDGTMVGYNEVSKLASLHHPAIQFRTGCFCNPGACQLALGLSDQQVIDNFEQSGHVCGDHIDLVNGLPTGAVRVSFGKDSIWEDLDVLVTFLEGTFVDDFNEVAVVPASSIHTRSPTTVLVSKLYLFPIKSCAAQRIKSWQLELPSGKLKYDREFALVDTSGTALRLQTCPKLGLIAPIINLDSQTMTISAPGCNDLVVNLSESLYHGGDNAVQVCATKCGGRLWGDTEVSEWFSSFLGIQCWLARYSSPAVSDMQNSSSSQQGKLARPGFSNEQPILLISENAVATLNNVLINQQQPPVGAKRFRPNVVVKAPVDDSSKEHLQQCHIEDDWKTLVLFNKGLSFKVEGGCPRCTMVDYDPTTGQKGRTLRALAKYRRKNGSIVFGIFLQAIYSQTGTETVWIEEGDVLQCS